MTAMTGAQRQSVPTLDSFGTRLAAARQHKGGWNVARAARACGIDPETWRKWEEGNRTPQKYEVICQQIAEGLDLDYTWIAVGPRAFIPGPGFKRPGFCRRKTSRRRKDRRLTVVPIAA